MDVRSDALLAGAVFGPAERLYVEKLLQCLRVGLLVVLPALVFSGPQAVSVAIWLVLAVAASFVSVELLTRYRAGLFLRLQLAARVVDCGLISVVLTQYDALLHNAYYDALYVLCVAAAAATHGRWGGLAIAVLAGVAVLAGRLQLMATGAVAYDPRHFVDAAVFTLLFTATALGVDRLMKHSAEAGMRSEWDRYAELSAHTEDLERLMRESLVAIHHRNLQLSGLAHDLRHPLTVIRIRARLLRRTVATRYLESVEHIERSAVRMTNGIDELLDTALAQSGQQPPLALVPTDLVQLVRDAIDDYQNALPHRLVLDARASSIGGQFDAPRLERALDNLVANAIKYSPAGGSIRLEVSAGADWAKVVICDQGVGIPATDLPHVFEPFRRGGNVVGRMKGFGIGLANARSIVEQHGGALSVESAPGEGSTFIVRLPLQPSPI
ncbi:MAG TPA: HAMP domain-containing sensor histidine kinase [Chloroflexota bacterium]|nr:HAMP domain-containing sensor histidine kinase [Chloroflexota bacterium]